MIGQYMELQVEKIYPNPDNPRKEFNEEKLQELAQSIMQNGVIQPVIVVRDEENGMYRLVVGERRWRGSIIAQAETIPAILRELSLAQELEIMNIENLQREDIGPIEEANSFKIMIEKVGYTQEQLAGRLGCSQGHIANRLRLLDLPEETRENITNKEISAGHGKILAGVKNSEIINKVVEQIKQVNAPVANTKELIYRTIANEGKSLDASFWRGPKFDISGCNKCPDAKKGRQWESQNLQLFCVNATCWEEKQQEVLQAKIDNVKEKTSASDIVDLDKLKWDDYASITGYDFNEVDKKDCNNNCQHLKYGTSYSNPRESNLYCFNKSCLRKKKMANTKEKNKVERERKKTEIEHIEILASTLGKNQFGKKELIWIIGMLFCHIGGYQERPTLFNHLKAKFGWDLELFKYPHNLKEYYFEDFLKLFEALPEDTIKELIFEWPLVQQGLGPKINQYLINDIEQEYKEEETQENINQEPESEGDKIPSDSDGLDKAS